MFKQSRMSAEQQSLLPLPPSQQHNRCNLEEKNNNLEFKAGSAGPGGNTRLPSGNKTVCYHNFGCYVSLEGDSRTLVGLFFDQMGRRCFRTP